MLELQFASPQVRMAYTLTAALLDNIKFYKRSMNFECRENGPLISAGSQRSMQNATLILLAFCVSIR